MERRKLAYIVDFLRIFFSSFDGYSQQLRCFIYWSKSVISKNSLNAFHFPFVHRINDDYNLIASTNNLSLTRTLYVFFSLFIPKSNSIHEK